MDKEWRNELVTKGAAVDAIMERDQYAEPMECAEAIKALPSAQPYTDAEIQKMQDLEQAQFDKMYQLGYEEGKQAAQPQRMKGRWIHDGYDIPHGVDWMHCSVCGRREPYVPAAMTNYCPTCGTEMETEQQ